MASTAGGSDARYLCGVLVMLAATLSCRSSVPAYPRDDLYGGCFDEVEARYAREIAPITAGHAALINSYPGALGSMPDEIQFFAPDHGTTVYSLDTRPDPAQVQAVESLKGHRSRCAKREQMLLCETVVESAKVSLAVQKQIIRHLPAAQQVRLNSKAIDHFTAIARVRTDSKGNVIERFPSVIPLELGIAGRTALFVNHQFEDNGNCAFATGTPRAERRGRAIVRASTEDGVKTAFGLVKQEWIERLKGPRLNSRRIYDSTLMDDEVLMRSEGHVSAILGPPIVEKANYLARFWTDIEANDAIVALRVNLNILVKRNPNVNSPYREPNPEEYARYQAELDSTLDDLVSGVCMSLHGSVNDGTCNL